MLKSYWRMISRIQRAFDNALVIVLFFFTYYGRDEIFACLKFFGINEVSNFHILAPIESYLVVLGIAFPLFNTVLTFLGAYSSMRLSSFWRLLRVSFVSSAFVFVSIGAVLFLLKLDLSRSFVLIYCALCALAFFVLRLAVLVLLRYYRRQGLNFRNILVVGTGRQARRVCDLLTSSPEFGVRIPGLVSYATSSEALTPHLARQSSNGSLRALQKVSLDHSPQGLPVLAYRDTFEQVLKLHAIDEVIFTDLGAEFATVQGLSEIAAEEGVRVTLCADFFSLEILRSETGYLGDIPLIHYNSSPVDSSALIIKRFFDVVVSSLLLVLLFPLMSAIAVAIKLTSVGPVFFRQQRVGLNGRLFWLYKFRSMVEDAESKLDGLRDKNEMKGPVFKLRDDPRITPIGRYLRRYSLDELPQLWNVVRGDMSLVGPRPPLPDEVKLYLRKFRRRLSMRPGITCTWQVSGRNDIIDFETWARLDLEYIDNWSLSKDFALLLRTVPAVLRGSGAR